MASAETEFVATPPDILSAIERGFQGEVYGEAMYAAMAAAQPHPERRWKWMALLQLECETKADMQALLQRLGGNCEESGDACLQGLAEAQRLKPLPWHHMLREFMLDLPGLIEEYGDLETSANFTGVNAEVLRRLTAHEVVTLQFCEAELAGREKTSIEPVLALLHKPPLRP